MVTLFRSYTSVVQIDHYYARQIFWNHDTVYTVIISLSLSLALSLFQSLCKLSATVLQRVARGSGRWTELTLDGLNKLMLLVEERLFPGEELAAAMAAAVGGNVFGPAASVPFPEKRVAGGASGAQEGAGSVSRVSPASAEMEGGWGENGTSSGALSHLVECMLEVNKGGFGSFV